MSRSFPITGIPTTGPLPERQDINRWFRNRAYNYEARQLSLFIRAIAILMKKDATDELSWFAIAGIHGEPHRSWDDVPGTQGFCSHNDPTFPTWHRPYQLLLEQCLHRIMTEILEPYQGHASFREWESAANTWRFPYWDWSTHRLPDIVVYGEWITIRVLLGSAEEHVRNPLWQFNNPGGATFDELGATAANYYSETRATSKWGIFTPEENPKKPWIDGVQNWPAADQALAVPNWPNYEWKYGGSIGEAVNRMLSPGYHTSWESFASTRYHGRDPIGPGYLSLEFIHNQIHNFSGGSDPSTGAGHMSTLAFAAFDPLFWLHHCNVDRLTSIWQLLNPTKFFDHPQDGDLSPNADLKPFFRDSQRTSWNSHDARETDRWGYTYDILHHRANQSDEDYLSIIRKTINELYGQTRKDLFNFPNIRGKENDYIVDIIYDRYGLNGDSYTIHFFLGPVDGKPCLYRQHPNHIESVYTFSSKLEPAADSQAEEVEAKPKCDNCQKQKASGVLSKGQIHLTSALLKVATDPDKPDLDCLEPEEVNQFLKRNLTWRVVDNSGNEIDIEQRLPRTKIFALKGLADHYGDSSRLSKYHDYSVLPDPCQGKPGGVGEEPTLDD